METDLLAQPPVDFGTRLHTWRTSALNTVLMVVAVAAMAAIALDVRRAVLDVALSPAVLASFALYAVTVGLALLRRVDTMVRAAALVVVGYAAAMVVFARGGLLGNEQVLLLALPIITLIVLGRRFGIATAALSLLLIAVMRLIAQAGLVPLSSILGESWTHPTDSAVPGIVFMTTLAGMMTLQWRSTMFRESIIRENAELYETSERLREFSESIVRSMDEGIILTDGEGYITFVNPSGAHMVGHTPGSLKGRPLSTILPSDEHVALDDAKALERGIESATRREAHLRTRTAEYVPVIWSSRPFPGDGPTNGTLSVFTDISDLKQTEEALRASEETARAILNATTESMILTDKEGRILDLNETAAERLGKPAEELVDLSLRDLASLGVLPPEVMESRAAVVRTVVDTGVPVRVEDEHAGFTFDRHYYPVRGDDGAINRLAIFSRDITAEREAERRARRAERLGAMGRVAATLAHEINNPLQAIRSNLELLNAFELDPDERRKRVEVSLGAIERLSTASKRALQLRPTRPEDRRLTPMDEPVHRSVELMGEPLRQAGIDVTVDVPATPILVSMAVDQIVQVLINLIVNAIDAIGDGGRLHLAARAEGESAVIEVGNSGPCLTPEQLEHLFDPHFTTKAGHAGLGLRLSQDIVEMHGGTISADNTEEEDGVVFRIALPRPGPE